VECDGRRAASFFGSLPETLINDLATKCGRPAHDHWTISANSGQHTSQYQPVMIAPFLEIDRDGAPKKICRAAASSFRPARAGKDRIITHPIGQRARALSVVAAGPTSSPVDLECARASGAALHKRILASSVPKLPQLRPVIVRWSTLFRLLTDLAYQRPPRAVAIPRAFRPSAI
jgi:hypothetical protein